MYKFCSGFLVFLLAVAGVLPVQAQESDFRGATRELCLTCHEGIETVSNSHRGFGCTVCHGGDAQTVNAEQAHANLIFDPKAGTGRRNPSSLSVVEKSCGQASCHAGHSRDDRNHIQRVKKSMMATFAGVISGLRYQWSGQSTRTAKYGMARTADEDGSVPGHLGAVGRLQALPFFSPQDLIDSSTSEDALRIAKVSRHIGDKVLRERCSQCHIDSPAPAGEFRSQGCAACHFSYAEDGRYKGEDPTISKSEPGHPAVHEMRPVTANKTCLLCHKSFLLQMEDELAAMKTSTPAFPGAGLVRQDVHLAIGFDCVDCHTQFDIMGDGNLYSKQHQAVEIRCETCHGDGKSFPRIAQVTDPEDRVIRLSGHYKGWTNSVGDWMAVTARNRKMTNVKVQKKKIVTLGKLSGETYPTPMARGRTRAHNFPPHRSRLECSSCHSQWAPRCNGCHTVFDQSAGKGSQGGSAQFMFESREPALMVGPRGTVVPMIPNPRRTLTVLDELGKPVKVLAKNGEALGEYQDWVFTNPHGYSGSNLAYAFNPHSVTGKARTCVECHLSPEALGLGAGDLKIGSHSRGREDRLDPLVRSGVVAQRSVSDPEAKGTIRGEPLAGTSQQGARPFSQKEISRILKAANCIPCHDRYEDPIYRNMKRSYAYEKQIAHRRLRDKMLSRARKN